MTLLEGLYKLIKDPMSDEKISVLSNPTPDQVLNISLNKSSDNMVRFAFAPAKNLLLVWTSDFLHAAAASELKLKYPDNDTFIFGEGLPNESGLFTMINIQSYFDIFENPEDYGDLLPLISLMTSDLNGFKQYCSEKGYKDFLRRVKDIANKLGIIHVSLQERLAICS